MRIPCPLCGEREYAEFTVLGDASLRHRPNPDGAGAQAAFHEYLHLRENPAGEHDELWYHEQGCRSWLIVPRDTTTHRIVRVVRAELAGDSQ